MKKQRPKLSGRAASAADLTPAVCLTDATHRDDRLDWAVSRPTTRRTRAPDADNRSDPALSGHISVSDASSPHRSPIRMHLTRIIHEPAEVSDSG